ncbi:glycosyltransferase [Streptomyces sp. NPDC001851]|uniref:glycosyltransferase n=1 Tax=Streptomyces sp. NPDC001851 TaxID=3154529 RepID=UPI00331FC2A7
MSDSETFLDVVIPAYREEEWLPDLLDCLQRQDLAGVRIIISCSCPPAEQDIPLPRAGGRTPVPDMSVVRAGMGVANARNAGAAAGTSPWILFLDSDVLIPDTFVSRVRGITAGTPAAAMTFGYYADSHRWPLRAGTRLCYWYLRLGFRLGRPALPGFATLVRRKVFEEIGGYRPDLGISEDFVFSDELAHAGHSITLHPDPWVLFSVRRFDTSLVAAARLLWRYLLVDLARRTTGRRYLHGQIDYGFGEHRRRSSRRYPAEVRPWHAR